MTSSGGSSFNTPQIDSSELEAAMYRRESDKRGAIFITVNEEKLKRATSIEEVATLVIAEAQSKFGPRTATSPFLDYRVPDHLLHLVPAPEEKDFTNAESSFGALGIGGMAIGSIARYGVAAESDSGQSRRSFVRRVGGVAVAIVGAASLGMFSSRTARAVNCPCYTQVHWTACASKPNFGCYVFLGCLNNNCRTKQAHGYYNSGSAYCSSYCSTRIYENACC